jgi:hypothetical protein
MERRTVMVEQAGRYVLPKAVWIAWAVTLLALNLWSVVPARAATLQPKTVKAWENYVRLTEGRINAELESADGFLIQDFLPPQEAKSCREMIVSGDICVLKMETKDEANKKPKIPAGMVHHWMGSIFVPDVELEELLSWIQNYSDHDQYFKEVERSELLSRNGDDFEIFFRLKRDKIVKLRYNTRHHVDFTHHSPVEVSSKSATIRIAQLENPDTASEREKPEGVDSGFLWRLNSYWRYKQVEGGVIVENETLSLSRGIPAAIRWLVAHYLDSIPREFMQSTLGSLRDGVTVQVARSEGSASSHAETPPVKDSPGS